jgi:tRNA (guanine37-N1)-methyltransferase
VNVRIGRVGRPHGLDGAFFVEQPSDDKRWWKVGARFLAGGEEVEVVTKRTSSGRPVIKLDRPVPRGTWLEVERARLPPTADGEFYVFQLVGLERRRRRPGRRQRRARARQRRRAADGRGLRPERRSRRGTYPCRARLRRPRLSPLQLDVFTLVPHAFAWLTEQRPVATVLGTELDLRLFSYRDYTPLRAGQVDDEPYGGGAGMVLRVDVVAAALDAVYGGAPGRRVIALTPQGKQLTQPLVEELAGEERLTLLSARYEGFDERILEHLATDAVSIGPYVLSNGDLPAMVLVDAIARRLPGALSEGSGELESFSEELSGGLEYPHYTRPAEFQGWRVPDVLLSGDHARIDRWRKEHVR